MLRTAFSGLRATVVLVVLAGTLAGLAAAAGPASAREVYLNGVKLEPTVVITNQTFNGCDVTFDAKGDVFITAKGYKVSVAKDAPAVQAAPTPRRFFLATTQGGRHGFAQYDVVVMLKRRGRDRPDRPPGDARRPRKKVTQLIHAGNNKVQVIASKNIGAHRLSTSADDTLEIFLGEGTQTGTAVEIVRPILDMKRTASETQTYSAEVEFNGPYIYLRTDLGDAVTRISGELPCLSCSSMLHLSRLVRKYTTLFAIHRPI